jgi:hypothetical protein
LDGSQVDRLCKDVLTLAEWGAPSIRFQDQTPSLTDEKAFFIQAIFSGRLLIQIVSGY